jgi:ATP-binding cassette subfamily E protein 1
MLVFEGEPARSGSVVGPVEKDDGLNRVLKSLNLTYRKDHSNGRARINKEGSVLDREQKKSGKYYYS